MFSFQGGTGAFSGAPSSFLNPFGRNLMYRTGSMKPEPGASLESARRSLAAASRALAGYRLMSGAEPEAAESGARDSAAAAARAALDEARARLALLQGERAGARRDAAAREAELASARGAADALG